VAATVPDEKVNVLMVTLPTNFKVAKFDNEKSIALASGRAPQEGRRSVIRTATCRTGKAPAKRRACALNS